MQQAKSKQQQQEDSEEGDLTSEESELEDPSHAALGASPDRDAAQPRRSKRLRLGGRQQASMGPQPEDPSQAPLQDASDSGEDYAPSGEESEAEGSSRALLGAGSGGGEVEQGQRGRRQQAKRRNKPKKEAKQVGDAGGELAARVGGCWLVCA